MDSTKYGSNRKSGWFNITIKDLNCNTYKIIKLTSNLPLFRTKGNEKTNMMARTRTKNHPVKAAQPSMSPNILGLEVKSHSI